MILTYEAIDQAGQRSRDRVDANDAKEAVNILRRRGLYVTRIAEDKRSQSRVASGEAMGHKPLSVLALFTRQTAMLLQAGSAVVPAMAAIQRQMKKPRQVAVVRKLIADLEGGTTFADTLRQHPRTFDPVYCAIVAAGEASGNLGEMLDRLVGIVGARRTMHKQILGALAYPILLIFMSFGILQVMLLFVLPRFADMFVQLGVETPASTKVLMFIGGAARNYGPVALVIGAAVAAAAIWVGRSSGGRQWLSNMQLVIPIIGRLRSRLIQAQIFRTMGTLLESRVGLLDTLALARESTRNNRFQALFDDLESTITGGGQLSTVFEASAIVEPYICQAIRTGEDSGNMGGALVYCADILDETNTELITVTMRLIEPVILILMGLVVGGVAISLFLPLFDLTSAIG